MKTANERYSNIISNAAVRQDMEIAREEAAIQEVTEPQEGISTPLENPVDVTPPSPAASSSLDYCTTEDMRRQADIEQDTEKACGNPRKVFVGNISFEVRSKGLKTFFSSFGNVKHVQLLWDRGRRRFKGSAFIMFCSVEGATAAKGANEDARTLNCRVMTVTAAEGRSRRAKTKGMSDVLDQAEDQNQLIDSRGDLGERLDEHLDALRVSEQPEPITVVLDESVAGTLPDNILIEVFSYLRVDDRIRIERVCRRWRHVALQSWQSLQGLNFQSVFQGFFAKERHALTHGILRSILKRGCSNLQHLDVSASPRLLNHHSAELIERHALTHGILRSILKRGCANLQHLDVLASPRLLNHHSAELIGRNCPNLTHLDLSGMKIDKHSLRQLSSLCTELKRVELRRCLDISEEGFWWLLKNSENLEYFDARENLRITGQCFYMLNPGCHTVIVDECTNLSDMGIKRLTDKCPGLKTLSISRCYKLTGASVQRIAEKCKSLFKLSLNGDYPSVPAEALASLGQLSALQELHLKDNLNVADSVLRGLAGGCSSLRLLDISGCYKQVTSEGLAHLASCASLEDVNVSYIDTVSDAAIEALAIRCPLKRFIAKSCPEISDAALIVLASHCMTLREVDLSRCEEISDQGVTEFVRVRQEMGTGGNHPAVRLTVGGTSVTDALPGMLPSEDCDVEVCLLDLSVPQHRLQLESYGKFFPSDEEDDWDEPNQDDSDPAGDPLQHEYPTHRHEPALLEPPPTRPPPDHSHHLEELGVDSMDEWNNQRQMHYGAAAAGYAMPEDYAEDFLDADDPSLWEDEFFVS